MATLVLEFTFDVGENQLCFGAGIFLLNRQ